MKDYSKTIIYKIICKNLTITKTYGGHTTNLIIRRQNHKSICNNINSKYYNCYLYKFIRENKGWDNWEIIKQYDFPCKTKQEALIEEQNFIDKNECELNTCKAFITEEQKKEKKKNKNKNFREKNQEYYKEWQKKNKEKQKEYDKKYKKNNKDKINEKIICVCGCQISKKHLKEHLQTKKHQQLILKL
jgi:hypothetical protein